MKTVFALCAFLAIIGTVSAKLNAPFTGRFQDLPTIVSADVVGAGFNAKTGQSGLMTVLTWTYQFNQTWQSPSSGIVYKVPDQLTLADQPESNTKVCTSMSLDFSTAFNAYTSRFAFSAGLTVGAFSAAVDYNRELQKVKSMTSEKLNIYSYSTHTTMVYSLVLPPAYVLNPSHIFLLAVEGLPASYSAPSDLQKYQEFVTAYGTHYVCLADMGGHFVSNSFLSNSYTKTKSLTEVTQQMSFEFSFMFFNLSTGGFHNRTEIPMESWFTANQQTSTFWNGGNPTYQSNETLGLWIWSIPDMPGLLNTTLCPISELVSDSGKAATLGSYITQYIAS